MFYKPIPLQPMIQNGYILAIESSCDDTGAAVLYNGKILANKFATQAVHAQYGGVVPELASRAHQRNIVPVVDIALKEAGISAQDLSAIVYTQGPGLMGSLLVGASFGKSMALSLGIPSLGVNHMRGHILSHFAQRPEDTLALPSFPYLSLIVSGGHTLFVLVKGYSDMTILGRSLDDAAGEAFDKSAKMLGLPYPGGPLIDKHAKAGQAVFTFNKPRVANLDMSFSGLKTSILNFLKKEIVSDPNFITENLEDICASIQTSIVEILIEKTKTALEQTEVQDIALAGGVAANSALRQAFLTLAQEKCLSCHIPPFEYCTDNAAMIGIAGYFALKEGISPDVDSLAHPNLPF
jgi:N6-L-threonylcarbamoyladenine synthase